MNLLYESPRMTQDVDFTTTLPQEGFTDSFEQAIEKQMAVAAADLGYVSQRFRVQSMVFEPPGDRSWPTLRVKIGLAKKGTGQEKRLDKGTAANVLKIDISFNEEVHDWQKIVVADGQENTTLLAYSIYQQIAEKLRAIIQQPVRNRYRRQDIFDIARIAAHRTFDDMEKRQIFDLFMKKSLEREIQPTREMISHPELYTRSKEHYHQLSMDSGNTALDFDRDFEIVRQFYLDLPWP